MCIFLWQHILVLSNYSFFFIFQVEIKKAEPRDSSNKMGGDNSWGPPQGGPQMGMGGGVS